jgi:hypothetical protein
MKFLTKIIFEVVPSRNEFRELDEQWRLIDAPSRLSAIDHAQLLATSEESTVIDASGQSVNWKFVAITDVICVDATPSGSLLFSETVHDTPSYISYLHERSKSLHVSSAMMTVEPA